MIRPVHLLFQHPPATDGTLIFAPPGDAPSPVPSVVELTLDATLPLPAVRISLIPGAELTIDATLPAPSLEARATVRVNAILTATLPGPTMEAVAQYRSNTQRPVVGRTRMHWDVAAHQADAGSTLAHHVALREPATIEAANDAAARLPTGIEHRLPPVLQSLPVRNASPAQGGTPLRTAGAVVSQDATRLPLMHRGAHQDATRLSSRSAYSSQDATRAPRPERKSRYGRTTRLQRAQTGRLVPQPTPGSWQPTHAILVGWIGRYQTGSVPPIGISPRILPPAPPQPEPRDPDLVFEGDGIVVPIQRIYVVANHVTLTRVSDGAEVPALSLSVALDADSFAFSFRASLAPSAEPLIAGAEEPRLFDATINGITFRVLIERISRDRTFGSTTLSVDGRGLSALLSDPYAPVMPFTFADPLSARQIAEQCLTQNGVPLGWAVDWLLEDWPVPGGTLATTSTWMGVLQTVAASAGAILVPHSSQQRIAFAPRYPVAPWSISSATPDITLPSDVITREGIQWDTRPAYNRVIVGGKTNGVLARVTRTGTAGDVVAQTVLDDLITDAIAARQRGLAVLASGGRTATATLRMPLLDGIGFIAPGKLVEYRDGGRSMRGYVRSASIDAGFPDVWQTLTVELPEAA